MRDVDHDAQAVHFGDDLPAERAEAMMFGLLVAEFRGGIAGIANLVVSVMAQRDVRTPRSRKRATFDKSMPKA